MSVFISSRKFNLENALLLFFPFNVLKVPFCALALSGILSGDTASDEDENEMIEEEEEVSTYDTRTVRRGSLVDPTWHVK